MKPPDYRITHFDEAYHFHDSYEPFRPFTKLSYEVIRRAMEPTLSADETTDALLPEILEEGRPLILAPNHTSDRHDQWLAAAAAREIERRYDIPIVGDVRVLGKSAFYTGKLVTEFGIPPRFEPRDDDNWLERFVRAKLDTLSVRVTPKLAQYVMTRFVNAMGTMPVYRPSDLQPGEGDARRLSLAAADRLWETCITQLLQGHPVGIFAEGTADTEDPRRILPVKAGIGQLATRLVRETSEPGYILPLGMCYPEYQEKVNRKGKLAVQPRTLKGGHVHLGTIHEVQPGDGARNVQSAVATQLQAAVTQTFAHRQPTFYDIDNNPIDWPSGDSQPQSPY